MKRTHFIAITDGLKWKTNERKPQPSNLIQKKTQDKNRITGGMATK
jgi:hypothetical protein